MDLTRVHQQAPLELARGPRHPATGQAHPRRWFLRLKRERTEQTAETLATPGLGALVALGLTGLGLLEMHTARRRAHPLDGLAIDRDARPMPPLALLDRPVWSPTRKVGMLALRGYLLVAAVLLVVKVVQLALA